MRSPNAAVTATLAAVAVLAVVAGGVAADRRRPVDGPAAAAAPLPVPSTTPTTVPMTPKPTAKPTAPTDTAKVKLDLAKLPTGRAPQLQYRLGRVVAGGTRGGVNSSERAMTIPGRKDILRAANRGGNLLAVLTDDSGRTELVRTGITEDRPGTPIPDVGSLVLSPDETTAAYATARSNPDNTRAKGSTVTWERDTVRTLKRPNDWGSHVLAVTGDKIWFRADTDQNGTTSALYVWDSASGDVERISGVRSPVGVDPTGALAADFVAGAAQNFCSTVTELPSGSRRWLTCDYAIAGFTPDTNTTIGTPDFRNGGADPLVVALDSADGKVRREWTGPQFRQAVAEDDDHLLLVADSGEGTRGAIIRCTISTGGCELATPLTDRPRSDLQLLGDWS
ncbi:hypothetical protein FB561_2286 [Kribbella amoyensis]|uniref:WD40 repeat protein n=1 Tax=Kribbella amoyensis TaxID=996641 RepID=A0A561BQV1_9ACTN|nr:hypothetical protein [Kribbella amoyensis]TWD81182.1 hypothetical protein FB561_2286 [Kribbella amoyensis]